MMKLPKKTKWQWLSFFSYWIGVALMAVAWTEARWYYYILGSAILWTIAILCVVYKPVRS